VGIYSLPEKNLYDIEPVDQVSPQVTTTATASIVNDDTKIINVDEYRVKDELNKELVKLEKKRKLKEEEKRIRDADRKRIRQERIFNFWKSLHKWMKLEWLISLIQSYEELLYVLFIDVTLAMVLFSILYIGYIILYSSSFSISDAIIKISGAIVISIICIIVQLNLPKNTKNEKEG